MAEQRGVKDRRRRQVAVKTDRRQTTADRRAHVRVPVDLEVDYQCEDTFLFAYITDISAMGIFVRTIEPMPPGTRLNLRFTPPGQATLSLRGQVMWVNPFRPNSLDNINPGMGIQFVDLLPQEREHLVNLVRTFAYLSDDEEARGNS